MGSVIKGLTFLALGAFILYVPQFSISILAVLFGIIAFGFGIFDIVGYIKIRRRTGVHSNILLIKGISSSAVGALMLLFPSIGGRALIVSLPLWIIGVFVFRFVEVGVLSRFVGKQVSIIAFCLNIAGLLLGILMLFNPLLFTMSWGFLAGTSLVVLGLGSLMDVFIPLGGKS